MSSTLKIVNQGTVIGKNPLYRLFANTEECCQWFQANHLTATEIFCCYYTKAAGKKSLNHDEVLHVALRYGWIDGVASKLKEGIFCNRWVPRRKNSNWSYRNICITEQLIKDGLMQPNGMVEFNKRAIKDKEEVYRMENPDLSLAYLKKLKKDQEGYKYFKSQSESYQKNCFKWIMSAKREETQLARLHELIESNQDQSKVQRFTTVKKK
ncbi:hypothetical protein CYY_000917 [Polysphondylium violaceum]|uniref:Uncharacterized protein n=1 Tax=Polysphondylium violaceum TaxID=133409 RepID=A0A8J4Q0Z2_9MYCE|nr:hypothetical protein CYY_000917 [Polysphondylium violaceum]